VSAADSPIFRPLRLRTLEVPNRVFRSSVAGRFDNYDGSMTELRMDWERLLGPNPSLTIAALADRFCGRILDQHRR
jgi:2,4-dienoyl-CoA reductase-like NADH-dependent reductase (Old Yellow Enzyme family)